MHTILLAVCFLRKRSGDAPHSKALCANCEHQSEWIGDVGGVCFVHSPGMGSGSDDDCSFEGGHNDFNLMVFWFGGKLQEQKFRFSSYQPIRFGVKTVNLRGIRNPGILP